MNKVQVMMSTYNGEKYLAEQIASLTAQEGVAVAISIRDDGSSDGTRTLLDEWQKKGILHWYTGANLRPKKSFLNLLKQSSPDADYYAFCDQDDYWESKKLLTAVQKIEQVEADIPVLYFSEALLVDENLHALGKSEFATGAFSFGEILIKNNGSGCTMVFNKALRNLIHTSDYTDLSNEPLHDHWIYMICLAAGGKVLYDPDSYIRYRQHGNNAVGGNRTLKEKIKENPLFNSERKRQKWSMELLDNYSGSLTKENRVLLEEIRDYDKSFSNRWKLAHRPELRTSSAVEAVVLKLTILLGKF